jgi:triphosphatase
MDLSGLNAEGVHEMRVALRRMRAAISDFQEIFPVTRVSWLKRENKWNKSGLGPRLGRLSLRVARAG